MSSEIHQFLYQNVSYFYLYLDPVDFLIKKISFIFVYLLGLVNEDKLRIYQRMQEAELDKLKEIFKKQLVKID